MKILIILSVLVALIAMGLFFFVYNSDSPNFDENKDVEEKSVSELFEKADLDFVTGVFIQVNVGPQCPVLHEDVLCPDVPYEGKIDVVVDDPERELIVRGESNSMGVFMAELDAGSYIVVAQTAGTFPLCNERKVLVVEGEVSNISMDCDSGIR